MINTWGNKRLSELTTDGPKMDIIVNDKYYAEVVETTPEFIRLAIYTDEPWGFYMSQEFIRGRIPQMLRPIWPMVEGLFFNITRVRPMSECPQNIKQL